MSGVLTGFLVIGVVVAVGVLVGRLRVLPDGAYAVEPGVNANGQRKTQGRVTSSYHSPTLNRPIAMGLVRHGPARMGQVLEFPMPGGDVMTARIVDPVFYDKEGTRLNG